MDTSGRGRRNLSESGLMPASNKEFEGMKRLMGALVRMPPKQHDEMKLGKPSKSTKRPRSVRGCFRQAINRFAFCLRVLGLVSRPVREALALDAHKGTHHPFSNVHAKSGTGCCSESQIRSNTSANEPLRRADTRRKCHV
jgi:hypothetical protein